MAKTDEAVDFIVSGLRKEGFSTREVTEIILRVGREMNVVPDGNEIVPLVFSQMVLAPELRNLSNLKDPTNCPGTL